MVNLPKAICCLLGRELCSPALLEAVCLSIIIQVHSWWLLAGCWAGWPCSHRSGGEETMAETEGVCTASLLQECKHCSVLLPWSWGHRTELGGLRKAAGLTLKEKFSTKLGTWRKKSELAVIIKTEKISLRAKSAP